MLLIEKIKNSSLLAVIKRVFRKDPNRIKYKNEFLDNLHSQSRYLHKIAGLVAAVIWLGYAFDTDPKLHPEFPEMIYFRLSLSFAGILVFIISFFDRIRGKGIGLLAIVILVMAFSTGFFTGRLVTDPNYVAGYQLVLLIVAITPFPKKLLIYIYGISLSLFVISILLFQPVINTPHVMYSLNNLFAAVVIGMIAIFLMDYVRFQLFIQHLMVSEKNVVIRQQMEEVQALKVQQDGDYFLTSILIKPLAINLVKSNSVQVDFISSQYKKFEFRNRKYEIGGDLNASYSIKLYDKNYTVFLNGDAMGKSIQGAGGALVLGTVFNALVTRTLQVKQAAEKHPEQWLKECFLELQNVFVAFDGSMLLSAVLGVVDENSGLLYFINAEHPWVVLYRDEKADFIENELYLRKIGIEGLGGKLQVRTFQLRPGDLLICGSDGRDDILLGYNEEDGGRIINEDENEFLNRVEDGRGDLEKIMEAISQFGEFTDDLSLLRISFMENASSDTIRSWKKSDMDLDEFHAHLDDAKKALSAGDTKQAIQIYKKAYEMNNSDSFVCRELYSLYTKIKDWETALEFCEQYCDRNPGDNEFLYFTAYVYKLLYSKKKNKDFLLKGIDFGERYRLRDHLQIKNLINLSDMYRLLGDIDRAKKIIEQAKLIQPNHESIKKSQFSWRMAENACLA
jgi:tetratricopeptide (TPR) repeat protein